MTHDHDNAANRAWQYLLAIGAVALATVLRASLDRIWGNTSPYTFYYAAIMAAVVCGGRGPALLATVLGGVAGPLLFVEPVWSLHQPAELIRLATFLGTGVFMSYLGGRLHAARAIHQRMAAELRSVAAFPEENPNPVLRANARGDILYANRPAGDMLASMECDSRGPLPRPILDGVRRVLEEASQHEAELACPDGRRFSFSLSPSTTEGRVNLYGRDITQRVKTEAALRQSEERFRSLADCTPVIMWMTNAFGVMEFVNHAYREFFGITLEQVTGPGKWQPLVHPEDADAYVGAFGRSLQTRSAFHARARVRRADGQWRWVESYGAPRFSPDGAFLGVAGSSPDITDRHLSEQALVRHAARQALLLEITREMIAAGSDLRALAAVIFDKAGAHLNADLCVNYQVSGNGPFLELVAGFGIPPEMQDRIRRLEMGEAFCGAVAAARAPLAASSDRIASDPQGALVHAIGVRAYACHPLLARDGRVMGTLSFGSRRRDGFDCEEIAFLQTICHFLALTWERAQAEREMEQARAAAESANRAKDQFIAVLSHELRTPLTPAVAALSFLKNDARLPGDVREDLQIVSRNLDLEVRLIADLLDISRAISGKLHMEKRPVDVASAIKEAARIVAADLDAKGQTLVIDMPDAPYPALADAARLAQLFWNLLRNAVKFSPPGSRIAVKASAAPMDACPLADKPEGRRQCQLPKEAKEGQPACTGRVTVQVIDQGSGIAPEMLPRLFNAFEQEPKARIFGGLGLGLSICKAVVTMHGGTIAARSEGVGKGATFTVCLPLARCPLAPEEFASKEGAAGQEGPPVASTPPGQARRLSILLVEDHPETARLMRRLLAAQGYDVTIAASVADGLAAVGRRKPDVLISDLGLPDGTGHDLLRQLLSAGCRIPAIALSGYGTAADIQKSLDVGFAEHLVKPLSRVEILISAIARIGPGEFLPDGYAA